MSRKERERKKDRWGGGRARRSPHKLFINDMAGSVSDDETTGKLHGTGNVVVGYSAECTRARRVTLSLSLSLPVSLSFASRG